MKSRHPARGFTLVELLIGTAIGLLTILIMVQAMAVSESFRRATSTGGDAQSNGSVAMYALQRDLRLAGYGLVSLDPTITPPPYTAESNGPLAMCANGTTLVYNALRLNQAGTATGQQTITMDGNTDPNFAPFLIYPGGAGRPANIPAPDPQSDVIVVAYSGSFGMVGNGVLFTETAGNPPVFTVGSPTAFANRSGFRMGDLVLRVGTAGTSCSIGEITNLPSWGNCGTTAGVGNSSQIDFAPLGTPYLNIYLNDCSGGTQAEWNPTTPLATYTTGKFYDLGAAPQAGSPPLLPAVPSGPVVNIYMVYGGKLRVCNLLAIDCGGAVNDTNWVPIADDVVGLKAYYGTSSTGNGQVDTWSQTTPTSVTGWSQLLAARIGLLARGKQFEKNPVTTNSTINWTSFTPAQQMFDLSQLHDTSGGAVASNWQYYHYRTFETDIPFRNMIWN